MDDCISHHLACDCRERQWKRMWTTLENILGKTTYIPDDKETIKSRLWEIRIQAQTTLNWNGK